MTLGLLKPDLCLKEHAMLNSNSVLKTQYQSKTRSQAFRIDSAKALFKDECCHIAVLLSWKKTQTFALQFKTKYKDIKKKLIKLNFVPNSKDDFNQYCKQLRLLMVLSPGIWLIMRFGHLAVIYLFLQMATHTTCNPWVWSSTSATAICAVPHSGILRRIRVAQRWGPEDTFEFQFSTLVILISYNLL